MVKITFPDGSVRSYEQGVTGLQIAESLSPALARDVVSCGINGETTELNRPINEDASINLYKFSDDEGKHTFWHTSAHLLAEALQELYPGIQFGFGPAVENGFFYDVMPANGQVISENDFPKIEAKMRELAKKNEPVVRREVSKADAIEEFKAMGQDYKVEHIDQDLEDGTITTYTQGSFTDLCRGPHLVSTGAIKAIKITSVAGAFWRGDAKREQMTRIYGITFPKKKMLDEYLLMLEEAKKNGATTICITGMEKAPITRVSDICMVSHSKETMFRSMAMASRIAQMAIIDALVVAVSFKRFERSKQYLTLTDKILVEDKM